MRRSASTLLLALALLLTACGQKGDLYLPSEEREAVATVPVDATLSPAPTPAADEDEETPAQAQPPR
jgi:predicted small lipoprotein YifL